MRALLTPIVIHQLDQVILKPGRDLLPIFLSGRRVLVELEPADMLDLPSGAVPAARQPLAEDPLLVPFFTDERVILAAGGISSLESWLLKRIKHCQWPHADYHHREIVTMRHEPAAIALCWSCDNKLRDHFTSQLGDIARKNVIEWVIFSILTTLGYNSERVLSVAEICWWAIYQSIPDTITESLARQALRIPVEEHKSVQKESDTRPSIPSTQMLHDRAGPYINRVPLAPPPKPVITLAVDPESPQTLFARPKRIRWENLKYLQWVKTQPCQCCSQPADDAHHLIGWGQGGMGTKAHDILTLPLCRRHHDELHRDSQAFEQKHGTQPEMIIRLLDRAYALGVLA